MNELLTQGFSGFLRRRRVQRHFQRRPLPGSLLAGPAGTAVVGQDLLAIAREDAAAALLRMKSHADGLDAAEASERLARDGPNEIQHEAPLPPWLHLLRCTVPLRGCGRWSATRPA
jgi:Mg2+-importing ATPase